MGWPGVFTLIYDPVGPDQNRRPTRWTDLIQRINPNRRSCEGKRGSDTATAVFYSRVELQLSRYTQTDVHVMR